MYLQHGGMTHGEHVVGRVGRLLEALVCNRLPHPHLQTSSRISRISMYEQSNSCVLHLVSRLAGRSCFRC